MSPKNWPKTFEYAPYPKPVDLHPFFLDQLLATGREQDLEKIDPCLEEGRCHPNLEIQIITTEGHPMQFLSSIRGHLARGVYATGAIEPGETLGEYVGEVFYVEKSLNVTEYMWQLGMGEMRYVVDAAHVANEMAFVNGYKGLKDMPNAAMQAIIHRGVTHFCYVAIQPIDIGEEILVDYQPKF